MVMVCSELDQLAVIAMRFFSGSWVDADRKAL
jgi:hypothetical protein